MRFPFGVDTFPNTDFNKVNLDYIMEQLGETGRFWEGVNPLLISDEVWGPGVTFDREDLSGHGVTTMPEIGDGVFYQRTISGQTIAYFAYLRRITTGEVRYEFYDPMRLTGPQGNPGEAQYTNIAPLFSELSNYAAGDYVFYNTILYRFTVAHAAGAWLGTDAEAVMLAIDVAGLQSAFDEALNPTEGVKNLCTGIEKEKYWIAWNNGDTVTLTSNVSYMAATVVLDGAENITLNRNWDGNSFSFYADGDNKRIGLVKDYKIVGVDYAYNVPSGAVYAYISQNISVPPYDTQIDTDGVVALEGNTSILGQYTIVEAPYGGAVSNSYYADNLRMSTVGGRQLKDFIPNIVTNFPKTVKSNLFVYSKNDLPDFDDAPANTTVTVLIPMSTPASDLPAHYPAVTVIKGTGLLTTILASNNQVKVQTYRGAVRGNTYTRQWSLGTGWHPWYQENYHRRYTCLKDGSGDFTNLAEAVQTACAEEDAELFVGPGEWDIISDLGADYMNAVSSDSSTWGLVLKNRVHIIGTANTIIKANYTGTNPDVFEYFSVFNAGELGFTLENVNITDSGIRYTIHDDRGWAGSTPYTNRYINCSMIHKNGRYGDCIGGGLGETTNIEIRGCYFEGDSAVVRLAYYHGNNHTGITTAKGHIIVADNYFAGVGTFQLMNYGDSTEVTPAYVSNNSFGTAPSVTNGSYPNPIIPNMQLVAWNNEVR